MHRPARVPGGPRSGLRAAVPSSFRLTLAGGITLTCKQAAARLPRCGWEVRSAGNGSKGKRWYAWAWLGTASPAASPADPPPPDHRRARLSLLLPARRPAGVPVPAGPRRRAALAGRRRFRVRQGLLRARPVPGPPLHRDRPAHRAGHGRPGHLRRHRRPAPPPHRHPGTRPGTPRPAPPADPGMIPLTVPETGRLLGHPPPPGSAGHWLDWRRRHQARSLAPPANTARPPRRDRPGQVANGEGRGLARFRNSRPAFPAPARQVKSDRPQVPLAGSFSVGLPNRACGRVGRRRGAS